MTLATGARLGPYEIVAPIGAGGMGEVYRARDPRLGREVAIKVLPEAVASDRSRLDRFEHEAKAVAALSHPNVLAIFDVGTGTPPFIVTELLDGETLRTLLDRGPLPFKRATEVALQLVAGLAAAHARGVMHRDLKPSNVFLTRDGVVKILDFGLAKSTAPASGAVDVTRALETMPGLMLGTVGYMAPEQVRGEAVDHRADIFAVGAMLYELLTGQRAFHGESPADTMSAVLREEPPDLTIGGTVPPALARIVRRCLEKEPDERFQSARDVRFALESMSGVEAAAPRAGAKESGEKSIAVLPFEDLSPDRSQHALCEGIAAEIINALGEVAGLRVTSRTSAVRCREKRLDIAEIGAHLRVQTVLEGTVRTAGERLRITAQLVDAADGTQLWASRYDRHEGDIFDIQDDIAAAIVENLKVRLVDAGRAPAVKRVTDNIEAYNLYLKGRYYWERRNQQFLKVAQDYFERAIAADPEYALAHAGVADCHTVNAIFGFRPGRDARPLARAAAERAVTLDPSLAESHHAVGAVYQFLDWNWTGAEASLRRALELNPKLAISHAYLGVLFTYLRRDEEAVREARLATAFEPDSALMSHIAGNVSYWLRRFDEARGLIDRALSLDPGAVFVHWNRPEVMAEPGQRETAVAGAESAVAVANRPAFLVSALARAYAHAGRRSDAETLVRELLQRREHEYIAPLLVAEIYAALGEATLACDWLERAYEDRNGFLPTIGRAAFFDGLRREPRFRALVRRLNLPD